MIKKIIFSLIAIALLLVIFVKLASNKKEIDTAAQYQEIKQNIPVEVITAQKTTYSADLGYTGTFKPNKEVSFGAEAQGRITELNIQEGQYVSAGQVIAKISDDLLTNKLTADKAQLEKARMDLERQKNLSLDNATTDAMLKQMELAFALANTVVQNTQKQIAMTRILAPISGVVTMKNFENGSIVAPSVPLGIITDVSQLKFEVLIPENQINSIRVGSVISLKTDVYPNYIFKGRVSLIAVKGDQNHNFKVEILVQNNNKNYPLKAGMFANMQASTAQQATNFLVPRAAVFNTDGESKIYIAQEGKATMRAVQTKGFVGENIAISEGLQDGELVITTGINNLKEGITVLIKK